MLFLKKLKSQGTLCSFQSNILQQNEVKYIIIIVIRN